MTARGGGSTSRFPKFYSHHLIHFLSTYVIYRLLIYLTARTVRRSVQRLSGSLVCLLFFVGHGGYVLERIFWKGRLRGLRAYIHLYIHTAWGAG